MKMLFNIGGVISRVVAAADLPTRERQGETEVTEVAVSGVQAAPEPVMAERAAVIGIMLQRITKPHLV